MHDERAEPTEGRALPTLKAGESRPEPKKAEAASPTPKRRPRFVVEAVKLLAAETSDGKVHLASLGQYLKRTDPAFSTQAYGHSGLLDMLRTYDLLDVRQESGGHWTVQIVPAAEADTNAVALHPSHPD